jgi:hypothetical protein
VLAAGGPRARSCARFALVLLLFGTLCGCLAAIEETGARAAELAGYEWLGASGAGRATLLCTLCATVVLPLSLASLGEMQAVSVAGVSMMIGLAVSQRDPSGSPQCPWRGRPFSPPCPAPETETRRRLDPGLTCCGGYSAR